MTLTDHAIRRFFEDRASTWDDRIPPDLDAILYDLAAPFIPDFCAARSILEIGTGTGAFITTLNKVAPQAQITSMDLAFAMVAKAQQQHPDAVLVQASVHHLPVSTQHFDLVVCHNSFPHFANKRRALSEIRRVLHPTGQLLILHNNSREFINEIHQRAGDPIDQDMLPTGTEMKHMLMYAGYTAIHVTDAPDHYIARGCPA